MVLDRDNKALPYLTGRAIAIVEHHARNHFGPNTLNTMFRTPEYPISVFARHVPTDDGYWAEVAGTAFPKHMIPIEQSQAWVGYYHQKAELGRNENRERIGALIAQKRTEKGLSIQELALLAGIDNSNMGKIEKGKYNVGIDILHKVCSVLGVKLTID